MFFGKTMCLLVKYLSDYVMRYKLLKIASVVILLVLAVVGYRYYSLLAARENLVSHLKTYEVYDENGPIKLIRHGRDFDGGYVVPELALESAQILMGYGIADDISFEENFSEIYKKHSYGFDCGVPKIEVHNEMCHFVSECISGDNFLYPGQQSSEKTSSFAQQLHNLNLDGKRVFIKMDIEGEEYDALPEILTYEKMVTGIVLEVHFQDELKSMKKVNNLLSSIDKDFILVHMHGNNCCPGNGFVSQNAKGVIPTVLELTYINKGLVKSYKISANQKHPTVLDMPNNSGNPDVEFEIAG